jgi:hypothetical protein
LTFIPGAVVVSLSGLFQNRRHAFTFILLSTATRLGIAGGGALLVIALWPSLPQNAFLFWLAVMYVLALAVEVRLTLVNSSAWQGLPALVGHEVAATQGLQEGKP